MHDSLKADFAYHCGYLLGLLSRVEAKNTEEEALEAILRMVYKKMNEVI